MFTLNRLVYCLLAHLDCICAKLLLAALALVYLPLDNGRLKLKQLLKDLPNPLTQLLVPATDKFVALCQSEE